MTSHIVLEQGSCAGPFPTMIRKCSHKTCFFGHVLNDCFQLISSNWSISEKKATCTTSLWGRLLIISVDIKWSRFMTHRPEVGLVNQQERPLWIICVSTVMFYIFWCNLAVFNVTLNVFSCTSQIFYVTSMLIKSYLNLGKIKVAMLILTL